MKTFLYFCLLFILLTGCNSFSATGDRPTEPPQIQGETFWWNETIFYEIFVRSFYDSDGDGIGDLQGIITKLDYLNDGDDENQEDLGINGIWLMPICESPSYHGYDVTDYQSIASDYGTMEDFLLLLAECQQRGIKVICDFVMNHSSSEHPWFMAGADPQSEYHDWYRWSSSHPGFTGPWGQPVWHLHQNGLYYYGLFWSGMPDLNYENPSLKGEMLNLTHYWLAEIGLDGFRCDAVKYIFEDGNILENTAETFQFWQEFHQYYKSVKPEAMAVGEAWDDTAIIVQYVGDKFDFCFEFELAADILNAVNTVTPSLIRNKMSAIRDLYPYHQYGTFLTNHDQNRVYNLFNEDLDKTELAGALYLTLPGVPFIYYGEEIAMMGTKPDPDIRRPMQWNSSTNAGFTTGTPWHSLNSNYDQFNIETMQQDPQSIWHLYRKLIHLRKQETALTAGTYQALGSSTANVLVYLREYQDEGIIVIANFAGTSYTGVSIHADSTNLSPGTRDVTSLLENEPAEQITIDENGKINAWIPLNSLAARSLYVLKLHAIP
ncbi:MAG: alpha-amylase [Candidatus Cloacimonetes bacterium]|nr:alpha-amylase [Candidatus Cloacimonadota bacterium]